MGRGVHRGFITHEELSKSLGKRNLNSDNLSQAFIHILNDKIVLVSNTVKVRIGISVTYEYPSVITIIRRI